MMTKGETVGPGNRVETNITLLYIKLIFSCSNIRRDFYLISKLYFSQKETDFRENSRTARLQGLEIGLKRILHFCITLIFLCSNIGRDLVSSPKPYLSKKETDFRENARTKMLLKTLLRPPYTVYLAC
jgi:hypothetical protein